MKRVGGGAADDSMNGGERHPLYPVPPGPPAPVQVVVSIHLPAALSCPIYLLPNHVLPASCPILSYLSPALSCCTYLLPYPAVSPFYLFGLHLHAPPVQHVAHPAQDVFLVLFYVPHQPYLFLSPFPRFYITSLSYLFCPSCYKFLTCAFCATLPRYLPVQ